jgi:AraC-like DNA-binding protein
MSDSVLDDVLNMVEARTTVFVTTVFAAPWGLTIAADGRTFFHIVTRGEGWLEVEDTPEPMRLRAGDFVILPHGTRHVLRDDPMTPAPTLEAVLASRPPGPDRRLRWGGDGAVTTMVCGEFCFPDRATDPLLLALPSCIRIAGYDGRAVPWLQATLNWLVEEQDSVQPGQRALVERLTDILFIQGVRAAFHTEEPRRLGWLGGLKDPEIARALACIHREPAKAWEVASLARCARMSRSAFAARFTDLVGESPIRYLTRWRMSRAATLLRSSEASLAEVAASVGYASEVAFGKAFKRGTGLAPGAYREQRRSTVRVPAS